MNKITRIVESGYSINIKSDYRNNKKMNAYIPTLKNMNLMEKISKDITRKKSSSYLISGAYGTGKSYFTSVLMNRLTKEYKKDELRDLNKMILEKTSSQDFVELGNCYNYLIVFAEDNYSDFNKSLNIGIMKSINENNLNIKLSTTYDLILEKIENWKNNYEFVYKNLEIELEKRGIIIDVFQMELEEQKEESYIIFKEIYSVLFAGEEFLDINSSMNIQEVLKDFEEKVVLNTKYDGVIYLFDEFGRYLETNIEKVDVKEVQDAAEYCNLENNSSLLLITHKDIFQYSERLNGKENSQEWEKVSGRFKKEHLSFEKNNMLNIISNILRKDKKEYRILKENEQKKFELYKRNLEAADLVSRDLKKEIDKYYPLNYITAQILPNLSQKVAQNERSLFAFLCGKEELALRNLTSSLFVGLDKLYDYFEENFKYLTIDSIEYKVFLNSKNALTKLNKTEIRQIRVIKSLAIIYIYNNFSEVSPTKEIMRLATNENEANLEVACKKLEDKNLISYRRHYNHYKLVEDVDINVDREVKKYVEENLEKIDAVSVLEENIPLDYYYPLKYNERNKIVRYLKKYYVDINDTLKLEDIKESLKEDGKIIYLLNLENKDNFEDIKNKIIEQDTENDLIIFSNRKDKKIKIMSLLKSLEAINRIYKSKKEYQKDGILKNEILSYKKEIISVVKEKLNRYFNPKDLDIVVNKEIKRTSKESLLEITNNYLENKYNKYIPLNYELFNKTDISSPIRKAKNEILLKVKNSFEELELEEFKEYISKTGAENSLARILLGNITTLTSEKASLEIEKLEFKDSYSELYENILNELKEKKLEENGKSKLVSGKKTFEELMNLYCLNNTSYGLRKSVVFFVIMLILLKHENELNISDSTNTELEFSIDLINKIEKNPSDYSISYIEYSEEDNLYLEELENIFKEYSSNSNTNKSLGILNSLKNYVYSLPRIILNYYSSERKHFKNVLKGILTEKNATEFLLSTLPKKYKTNNKKEILDLLKSDIQFFREVQSSIDEKIEKIVLEGLETKNINLEESLENLKNTENTSKNELKRWLSNYNYKSRSSFIKDLTKHEKGFDYYNWYEIKDFEDFYKSLEEKLNEKAKKESKENIVIINGESISVSLEEKKSPLGGVLKTKLLSDIKNMGITIKKEEKRKILLELLLEI